MKLILLLLPLSVWAQAELRPPATPLVTHDPYFSLWSMSDELTADDTRHWTGTPQPIAGIVRVDGSGFRFLGADPEGLPAMRQMRHTVTPTRTIYELQAAGVALRLTFFTPAFADDLDILSRPLTYVIWRAESIDGKAHTVDVYLDATSQLAVNSFDQRVYWSRVHSGQVTALRIGSVAQEVLSRSGDDLRVDWGYFYLALPPESRGELRSGPPTMQEQFARTGALPGADLLESPPRARRDWLRVAASWTTRRVDREPVEAWAMLAYDDLYAIQYLERNLRPWWRRQGMGIGELLQKSAAEFDNLRRRAVQYDQELTNRLIQAGGQRYAAIAVLAYRQALAAHKLAADVDGTALYFSKESSSNGCIATVDVTYPSAPLFLALSPRLMQAMLQPILEYASLPRWRFRFAPHDLGQYPLANGQRYGGGENSDAGQMPVEESSNMLILTAALVKADRSSVALAKRYWPVLSTWAAYLRETGVDPDSQLSTDDFTGYLAHNANLSVKAIVALGAYAQLAGALKQPAIGKDFMSAARSMALRWTQMAADGDHYKLAFDRPGTWSQKYNLVWDRALGLHLFPGEVATREMAHYRRVQNTFGLPLDNRATYTKLDWLLWTATLTGSRLDFDALIDPAFRFLNETESRVPMSDLYDTKSGRHRKYRARSVVGGVFMPLLNPIQ